MKQTLLKDEEASFIFDLLVFEYQMDFSISIQFSMITSYLSE
jgi:hypothetical protein